MSPTDTFIAILLAVGALQGIIFGILFLRRKMGSRTANRLLATLLFCFAYRLLLEVLLLFGVGRYDLWYHLTLELNWAYGPLIYLFVRSWLRPEWRLQRADALHFLPVVLELICSTFVRSQNFYWDGTRESLSWLGYWGYVVWMNYPTKYVMASLLLVVYTRRAERIARARTTSTARGQVQSLAWLPRLLRVFWGYFAVIVIVVLLDFLLFFDASFRTFYYYFTRFYYYPLFIGIAGLTYWLGLAGYLREWPTRQRKQLPPDDARLTRLEALSVAIDRSMQEDKAFRDPELTLQRLADRLNVKAYLLSECFREVMDTRFPEYVNRLRVAEWKLLLADPTKAHYSLLGLAYEAGFNSKASFHRAVKKEEGVTPGRLRDRLAKSLGE